MNATHRFPKWLFDERFEISYAPTVGDPSFSVVLFSRTSARYCGYGDSIAGAAKEARKKREAAK